MPSRVLSAVAVALILTAALAVLAPDGTARRAASSSSGPRLAHIYWSEPAVDKGLSGSGANTIWRADINGTSVRRNFAEDDIDFPEPVAAADRYVYWGELQTNCISRATAPGGHVSQCFMENAQADGLAVTRQHIYWLGSAAHGAELWRSDRNGRHRKKLASLRSWHCCGAGLVVSRTHIYWTDGQGGTIGRADLDGSHVRARFITGLDGGPQGLALQGRYLYWTENATGTIGRANLNGTGITRSFISGASQPIGLAIGAGHLYWANYGTNWIARARLDGTHVNEQFISAKHGYTADPAYVAVGP